MLRLRTMLMVLAVVVLFAAASVSLMLSDFESPLSLPRWTDIYFGLGLNHTGPLFASSTAALIGDGQPAPNGNTPDENNPDGVQGGNGDPLVDNSQPGGGDSNDPSNSSNNGSSDNSNNGSSNNNNSNDPGLESCPISFECCPDNDPNFEEKPCSAGYRCENHVCRSTYIDPNLPDCPDECCLFGLDFKEKLCPGLDICESNVCVKPDCPNDCCDSSSVFKQKSCSSGLLCESNVCVKPDCPDECCDADSDYKEKICSGLNICENSVCVKPDCPSYAECCSSETIYEEKECSGGADCYLHVCDVVRECTDESICIAAALIVCAKANSNPTVFGETYTANVTGVIFNTNYCELYVKLDSSPVRPADVGKDMTCEVPYTLMGAGEFTAGYIEGLITGQYPDLCSGNLMVPEI